MIRPALQAVEHSERPTAAELIDDLIELCLIMRNNVKRLR